MFWKLRGVKWSGTESRSPVWFLHFWQSCCVLLSKSEGWKKMESQCRPTREIRNHSEPHGFFGCCWQNYRFAVYILHNYSLYILGLEPHRFLAWPAVWMNFWLENSCCAARTFDSRKFGWSPALFHPAYCRVFGLCRLVDNNPRTCRIGANVVGRVDLSVCGLDWKDFDAG